MCQFPVNGSRCTAVLADPMKAELASCNRYRPLHVSPYPERYGKQPFTSLSISFAVIFFPLILLHFTSQIRECKMTTTQSSPPTILAAMDAYLGVFVQVTDTPSSPVATSLMMSKAMFECDSSKTSLGAHAREKNWPPFYQFKAWSMTGAVDESAPLELLNKRISYLNEAGKALEVCRQTYTHDPKDSDRLSCGAEEVRKHRSMVESWIALRQMELQASQEKKKQNVKEKV